MKIIWNCLIIFILPLTPFIAFGYNEIMKDDKNVMTCTYLVIKDAKRKIGVRCENSEVICYAIENGNPQCKFK